MTCSKKAKLTVSNNDGIPFISLHVVQEILYRSDAETLFHCAFVCKDWNDLITSIDFISRNSKQTLSSRNQILLIKVCDCKNSKVNCDRRYIYFPYCHATCSLHLDNNQFDLFHEIESPIVDDFKGAQVIGTSNGLVCLVKKRPFKFILWNPAIRKYVWLPIKVTWSKKLSNVGFGFDSSNNNFKVVNFIHSDYNSSSSDDDEMDKVESAWVFSYVAWSWKRLNYNIPYSFEICPKPHVSFNSVIYWLARDTSECDFILTFDLTNEVLGQISLPGTLGTDHDCSNYILTTGDSLAVVQLRELYNEETLQLLDLELSMWIMKEDSWTNIFSNSRLEVFPHHMVGLRKNGDVLFEMTGGQICSYNPTTSTNVLVAAIKNSVFFSYHTESLYLLEKKKFVNSY